ncbi:DUF1353 domain-containing protein [Pseudomonas sp. NPDC090201]|uniref:DUF1353 domain-containing protein n=1 Tax=Pseudomonas sp. NPDC090201 TaxID=3364475 RepID=UPI0038071421
MVAVVWPAVGRFGAGVAVRQVSRWQFQLLESLVFNDPIHGVLTVDFGFQSDLASIRMLRTVSVVGAIVALAVGAMVPGAPWISALCWAVALVAIVLYALLTGYGMAPAILHDRLYEAGGLSRSECDAVFYRALHMGDGVAKWRAGIFWVGVRLGGMAHYGPGRG